MTTTKSIDEILSDLQQEFDAMLAPGDVPGDWTENKRTAYERKRMEIPKRVSTIRLLAHTVAELAPQIAAESARADERVSWRATLCDELVSLQPRTRQQIGAQQSLKLSILCLDHGLGRLIGTGYALETIRLGELMRTAGYIASPPAENQTFGRLPWVGTISEIEARLATLTTRLTQAQRQLDEALLDDAAREQLAIARAAERDRRNAQPVLKTRGDGSQYLKYRDGRIVEIVADAPPAVETT